MGAILGWLKQAGYAGSVAAIGHRVVHGGPDLAEPMLIDDAALVKLKRLIPLAPLHQPHNIAGIEAAIKAFPSTPQVACFATRRMGQTDPSRHSAPAQTIGTRPVTREICILQRRRPPFGRPRFDIGLALQRLLSDDAPQIVVKGEERMAISFGWSVRQPFAIRVNLDRLR